MYQPGIANTGMTPTSSPVADPSQWLDRKNTLQCPFIMTLLAPKSSFNRPLAHLWCRSHPFASWCQQLSSFSGTQLLESEYIWRPIVELLRDRAQHLFPSWILRCHDSSGCTADTRRPLEGRCTSENAHHETFPYLPSTSSTENENIIAEAGKAANGGSSLRQNRF